MLFIEGDHVPVIPSFEVFGSVKDDPGQYGSICVNVGTMFWETTTVIVVVLAHCPGEGVNVYVVVVVEFIAGDQVPLIPSAVSNPSIWGVIAVNQGVVIWNVSCAT